VVGFGESGFYQRIKGVRGEEGKLARRMDRHELHSRSQRIGGGVNLAKWTQAAEETHAPHALMVLPSASKITTSSCTTVSLCHGKNELSDVRAARGLRVNGT
jgi:hypothetical protein